jgi:hypothetical protein
MKPEDMFQEPPKLLDFEDKDVKELWPQARGELWAFADNMYRRGMTITALQLRMAVALADEAFKKRFADKEPEAKPENAPDIVWGDGNG